LFANVSGVKIIVLPYFSWLSLYFLAINLFLAGLSPNLFKTYCFNSESFVLFFVMFLSSPVISFCSILVGTVSTFGCAKK